MLPSICRRGLIPILLVASSLSQSMAQPKAPVKPAPEKRPELALQTGHSLSVNSLAYSPDGGLIASGSSDGTVKIWDAHQRELIRTIPAHISNVNAVAWSPDARTIASAGDDGTVKFWNPGTGTLQRTISPRPGPGKMLLQAKSLDMDSNGTTLAVGYSADSESGIIGELVTYDARSGRLQHVLTKSAGGIYSVTFSPGTSGRYLASGGSDSVVHIWDARTGALVTQRTGHTEPITSVGWSPDGTTLVSSSYDTTVRVWKIVDETSRVLFGHRHLDTIFDGPPPQVNAKVLDRLPQSVNAVAFSPDGRTLVSSSFDGCLATWDVTADYAPRKTVTLKLGLNALAFSSDQNTLAVGGAAAIELREVKTLAPVGNFEARWRWTSQLAYSPDGKMLAASGGSDALVFLWDTRTGRLLRVLSGSSTMIYSLAWSPNGKTLAGVGGRNKKTGRIPILIWRANDGAVLHRLPGHAGSVATLAFSPDGNTLASGGRDSAAVEGQAQIKLWNTKTGTERRTLPAQRGYFTDLAWSPDGKTLAGSSSGPNKKGLVQIWNLQTGKVVRSVTGLAIGPPLVAFTHDGSAFAAADTDNSISLWNTRTGKKLRSFSQSSHLRTLEFSRDGSTLASGADDPLIRLWNAKTGQFLRVLRGHDSSVPAIAFSPDGSKLASGSTDTSIRIWKPSESRQLAALLTAAPEATEETPNPETLWLTTTPQGYYDAAEGADYLIKWRFNNKLLPFYHFEETYRRPDILRRALAGERIAARPLLLTRVPPMIRIISPQPSQILIGKSVRMLVEAADDDHLEDFKMYVNGVLVPDTVAKPIVVDGKPIIVDGKPIIVDGKPIIVDGKPIVVDGKDMSSSLRPITADGRPITADGRGLEDVQQYAMRRLFVMDIPLPDSTDEFVLRAVVTDNEQNKSDAAVMVKSAAIAPVRGDLYLLCVGVSQYRNPNYNIGFAAGDATGIARVLASQQGSNYAQVKTTVLTDKQATTKNIRAAFTKLKNARPNDTVMVFLSGHGLRAKGRFYFAPWGTFINDIPGTCLEWNEMLGALQKIYARKLLFTDACFSGSKLGASQATSGELAELAHKNSGLVMLSSSQADEFSFEDKASKQGAFSLALMEAFAGKCDVDGDAKITLSEVALYVPKRVSTLTQGLQNPQLVLVQDFNPQTVLAKIP